MDIKNANQVAAIVSELNELKDVLETIMNNPRFKFVIEEINGCYFLDKTVRWKGKDDWRTLGMIEAYRNRIIELEEKLEKL